MESKKSYLYQINNLSFEYSLGSNKYRALDNISTNIDCGAFICLSGPSGSGKTTLLNLLGLIEPPQRGTLLFKEQNLAMLNEASKNTIRRFDIGYIFQAFHLSPVLTARENVEYFLIRQGLDKSARQQRVEQALRSVNLWEQAHKKPLQMSGGQRQRVAIARALAKNPQVIIADEPTASLDQKTGQDLMQILRQLNSDFGVSLIISSHDPMVLGFAKQIIKLKDGAQCF